MNPLFSKRSFWPEHSNRLTQALEKKRSEGIPVLDLTQSNPTQCGFEYPQKYLPGAFSDKRILSYDPDPKGSLEVRKLISSYYAAKNAAVDPEHIVLTASTSEAYGFLFKLLCDSGDAVLVPRPGYPLFESIADLHDIVAKPYFFKAEENRWILNIDSLKESMAPNAKAMIIVHPNNPTGQFFTRDDLNGFYKNRSENLNALIADEVFLDFDYSPVAENIRTLAAEHEILTFTLGGASKMLGLPQLKLGWIVVGGPQDSRREALRRLEVIADTYLSVSAAAQSAFIKIYENKNEIQNEIKKRVLNNLEILKRTFGSHQALDCQEVQGGWYALLKSRHHLDEEAFCLKLLDERNIFIHPGYFFDLPPDSFLGVSLLVPEEAFSAAIEKLSRFAEIHI